MKKETLRELPDISDVEGSNIPPAKIDCHPMNINFINAVVSSAMFPDPAFQACTQVAEHALNKVNGDKSRLDDEAHDSIVGKGN